MAYTVKLTETNGIVSEHTFATQPEVIGFIGILTPSLHKSAQMFDDVGNAYGDWIGTEVAVAPAVEETPVAVPEVPVEASTVSETPVETTPVEPTPTV